MSSENDGNEIVSGDVLGSDDGGELANRSDNSSIHSSYNGSIGNPLSPHTAQQTNHHNYQHSSSELPHSDQSNNTSNNSGVRTPLSQQNNQHVMGENYNQTYVTQFFVRIADNSHLNPLNPNGYSISRHDSSNTTHNQNGNKRSFVEQINDQQNEEEESWCCSFFRW